ncbi:MAG: hypothetical protein LBR32_03015 [Propionibacteriaceae bacterium]|jgi:hypothetical protein|nr:hypothetical protein [Propionibacteriaceae bacterium]
MRKTLAWLIAALLLAACDPTSQPSPSPAPEVDFTKPGAASAMVARLMEQAGADRAVMVAIRARDVQVSVLDDGQPATWAYRDGKIAQVKQDLAYVDQASFDPADFDISDVGAMFRAAAGVCGSSVEQMLQIVDYSGGRVMMSVTTNPESRTVFFNADSSLLETLDFNTPRGVQQGLREVVGLLTDVYALGVSSTQGAWVEFPGTQQGVVVRRQRSARVPPITTNRAEQTDSPTFSAQAVDAAVIWTLVDSERGSADVPADADWEVRVEPGPPAVMRFTVGQARFATTLDGQPLANQ